MVDERREQLAVLVGVGAQTTRGRVHRSLEHRHPTVVERVRERGIGMDPAQPVLLERKRTQRGRTDAERVNRGADVVDETRARQRRRAHPAAGRVRGLEHDDSPAGLRECDRGDEPVRARTHDHRVCLPGHTRQCFTSTGRVSIRSHPWSSWSARRCRRERWCRECSRPMFPKPSRRARRRRSC